MSVLRSAFTQAREWGLVAQSVATLVDSPRHTPREIEPLTPDQARKLLEVANGHRLGAVHIGGNSGRIARRS